MKRWHPTSVAASRRGQSHSKFGGTTIVQRAASHNIQDLAMAQPQRRCRKGGRCDHHLFSLKGRADTHYKQTVEVRLCPHYDVENKAGNRSPSNKRNEHQDQIFPIFNNDQKWYTPAFCLGVDRLQQLDNDREMLTEQLEKIRDSLQIKHQMLFPRPSHKNKYCSVCQSSYEDYLDHISSQEHKRFISKAKFNKHLLKLCSTFPQTHPKDLPQPSIRSTLADPELIPRPRKIRKHENETKQLDEKAPLLHPTPSTSTNMSIPCFQSQNAYNWMWYMHLERLKYIAMITSIHPPFSTFCGTVPTGLGLSLGYTGQQGIAPQHILQPQQPWPSCKEVIIVDSSREVITVEDS